MGIKRTEIFISSLGGLNACKALLFFFQDKSHESASRLSLRSEQCVSLLSKLLKSITINRLPPHHSRQINTTSKHTQIRKYRNGGSLWRLVPGYLKDWPIRHPRGLEEKSAPHLRPGKDALQVIEEAATRALATLILPRPMPAARDITAVSIGAIRRPITNFRPASQPPANIMKPGPICLRLWRLWD